MASSKLCSIDGCDKRARTRGWCQAHYCRFVRHGNPLKGGNLKQIKGQTKHSLYNTWIGINGRCYNKNDPAFKRYGGRGITVCERWRNDFWAFVADMGPRPSPRHTIERMDNNKGYEPDNCCWATRAAQARNRRDNCYITANGKTQIVGDWAVETGICYNTIQARLRHGWSEQDAVSISTIGGGNQWIKKGQCKVT